MTQILLLIHVVMCCGKPKRWQPRDEALRPKVIKGLDIAHNGSGLCVVALSINFKLTTTLDRAITQNPCYVPFLFGI